MRRVSPDASIFRNGIRFVLGLHRCPGGRSAKHYRAGRRGHGRENELLDGPWVAQATRFAASASSLNLPVEPCYAALAVEESHFVIVAVFVE